MAPTTISVQKWTLMALSGSGTSLLAREACAPVSCAMTNNIHPVSPPPFFSTLYKMILNHLKHRIPCYSGVGREKYISFYKKSGNRTKKSSHSPTSAAGEGKVLRTEPATVLLTVTITFLYQLLLPFRATLSVTGSLFKSKNQ